jgi:hypothetical protein
MERKITNGYDLASEIIKDYENHAIDCFFQLTKGCETKWLELKASLVGIEATPNDIFKFLFNTLYKEALSLTNQDGGILLIGLINPIDNQFSLGSWQLSDPKKTHTDYQFVKSKHRERIVSDIITHCLSIPYLKNNAFFGTTGYYANDLEYLFQKIIKIIKPLPYQGSTVLPVLIKKRDDPNRCILLRQKISVCGKKKGCESKIGGEYTDYILYIRSTHDTGNAERKPFVDYVDCAMNFRQEPTNENFYQDLWNSTKEIVTKLKRINNYVEQAIQVSWSRDGSLALISVVDGHPEAKAIAKFLASNGGTQVSRDKYIKTVKRGLESVYGRGCCPQL